MNSRIIKFRAWNGQRMVSPAAINEYGWYETGRDYEDGLNLSFDRLMQYSGLKDKNGVEIYEGDLIKVTSGEYVDTIPVNGEWMEEWKDLVGEIVYEDGAFMYTGHSAGTLPLFSAHEDIEVIGNCYENPELVSEP